MARARATSPSHWDASLRPAVSTSRRRMVPSHSIRVTTTLISPVCLPGRIPAGQTSRWHRPGWPAGGLRMPPLPAVTHSDVLAGYPRGRQRGDAGRHREAEREQDFDRGALTRLHPAVQEPLRVRRGVLAGEVNPPFGYPRVPPVFRQLPRDVGGVGAPGPRVAGPVVEPGLPVELRTRPGHLLLDLAQYLRAEILRRRGVVAETRERFPPLSATVHPHAAAGTHPVRPAL